ncbi:MAG TPA: hypothetical protein VGD26_02370 [Chitinophagaceae bacterium]|jgi:hypothetical protein
MDKNKPNKLGDEAPTGKDFLVVVLAVAMLIFLSWIAWHTLGWFH